MTTGGYHSYVKAVGIKQLKAKLSEYVRLVRSGETILVTERDQIVAELRPARRQPVPRNSLEEELDALAQAGEITRSSAPKGKWVWRSKGLSLRQGIAQELLDDVRSEAPPS